MSESERAAAAASDLQARNRDRLLINAPRPVITHLRNRQRGNTQALTAHARVTRVGVLLTDAIRWQQSFTSWICLCIWRFVNSAVGANNEPPKALQIQRPKIRTNSIFSASLPLSAVLDAHPSQSPFSPSSFPPKKEAYTERENTKFSKKPTAPPQENAVCSSSRPLGAAAVAALAALFRVSLGRPRRRRRRRRRIRRQWRADRVQGPVRDAAAAAADGPAGHQGARARCCESLCGRGSVCGAVCGAVCCVVSAGCVGLCLVYGVYAVFVGCVGPVWSELVPNILSLPQIAYACLSDRARFH